jgi:2-polyprenyl-6-methoxyphenol hydroxylase-like FAD-dependent oxidoreductase
MTTDVGIVGAGIAGLHLGLRVMTLGHGMAATIYTSQTPEEKRAARVGNVVIRFAPTRQRERLLGVNHWDDPAYDLHSFSINVVGPRPLSFDARVGSPAGVVDLRLYEARLLEDFVARGGRVVKATLHAHDLDELAAAHDLLVVASGRGSLSTVFERVAEHSPYAKPQRLVAAGLFTGVARREPLRAEGYVSPGNGEMLIFPMQSFSPGLTGMGVEAIPGGAFEALYQPGLDEPERFIEVILTLLREHAPPVFARIDPARFALSRPLDRGNVAITPAVRRGYARLPGGALVVALGDARMLIDPITGQGANTASRAAFLLADAILTSAADGGPFDEAFCARVEDATNAFSLPVSAAAAARLRPAAPHVLQFMAAASRSQAVADAYGQGLNEPDKFWEVISSPDRTADLLAQLT